MSRPGRPQVIEGEVTRFASPDVISGCMEFSVATRRKRWQVYRKLFGRKILFAPYRKVLSPGGPLKAPPQWRVHKITSCTPTERAVVIDRPVGQGSEDCAARFCGLEHVGDGRGSDHRADRRRAARCAAGFARAAGQFCTNASRCPRFGHSASTRQAVERGPAVVGASAGAPFLPKLTELAKGNLPFAVGTMVLLTVGTVGYLPLVLPLLLPGVAVDSTKIARSLFLLMLLPLAAGLVLKAQHESMAARVKLVLDWVSNISLVPLVLLVAAANFDKILLVLGTRGILAGILLIAFGFGIKKMLGPGTDTHEYWLWYRTAQHCRRTRGREPDLRPDR